MTFKIYHYNHKNKSSEFFNYSKGFYNIFFKAVYCFIHFAISYYALGFLHWSNSLNLVSQDQKVGTALIGLFYYLSSQSYISALLEWIFIFSVLKNFPIYIPMALFSVSINESLEYYAFDQLVEADDTEPVKDMNIDEVNNITVDYVSDVDSEATLGSPNLEFERIKELPIPDSTPKVVEVVKVSVIERQRWYPFSGWSGNMFNKDPLPFSVSEPNILSLPNISPTLLSLPKSKLSEKHSKYPIQITSYWLWAALNNPQLINSNIKPQFEIEDDWTFYKAGWKNPQKYSDFGCVVRSRVWSCNLIRLETEDYCYKMEHCTPFDKNFLIE
ncbi:hypothetical protein CONCODRAFT_69488 [Conidiobolus coronatus NRRL 28638]|uniref:Uncharacterized protein n=1 Tax=Conidiobolus coronatus (strain ATCC 28846 / CBS 209.66 / NRRL 28638) TaxID=796925 RepID=A0A137PA21_CONC2|nr:hypothetical protein CONCODRAFT_69488 [Conidiobolus coronatus NRRL 28638]|eukprot:KXN71849.1 hypothetical protein CONCODRAFT_69488 [Conidiobolus coronatus NRRL 28638]